MTIYFKNKDYTIVYDQRGVKPAALRRLPQLRGELIIDEMHVQSGGALWDFFKGPRDGPSPQFREWLAEHGDEAILDLRLSRQPLSNYLTRFLDLISLGGFSAKVDELGYVAAEHWGLVVTTTRGSYLIEKNAFIEARDMTEQLKQVAGEGDPSISNIDSVGPTKGVLNVLTDTAHTLDRVIHGDGKKKTNKKRRKKK